MQRLCKNVTCNRDKIVVQERLRPVPHGGVSHVLRCVPSRCVHVYAWTYRAGTQRNKWKTCPRGAEVSALLRIPCHQLCVTELPEPADRRRTTAECQGEPASSGRTRFSSHVLFRSGEIPGNGSPGAQYLQWPQIGAARLQNIISTHCLLKAPHMRHVDPVMYE